MNLIRLIAVMLLLVQLEARTVSNNASASTKQTTDRMIIKYKDDTTLNSSSTPALTQSVQKAGEPLIKMNMVRKSALKANIVKVNINGKRPSLSEMKGLAKKLSKRSDIEYAEPDYIMQIMQVPNDTYYASKHWHYQNTPGGANIEGAWDITTGSASDVIAVIDTGILPHAELVNKTLPGYDFIVDTTISNDGNGRDADPTDPGDWTLSSNSSWHGTHVAGTIAAQTNNGSGISGINWNGKILPVRVLGTGGGYTSDIAAGMLWAAGIAVTGVPTNPNPAKVLNLSLGGTGDCSTTYSNAITAINATGAIVVVAAGNSNEDASLHNPANCSGVITVAASARDGGRAYYSNYGSLVDITAPGGDYTQDSQIYSTLDGGTTTAKNDNSYAAYQGTSMATPHVAGIISLITSVLPSADYTQVKQILQDTVRPFPTGTGNDCTTSICGPGIIDATAAVTLANPSLDPGTYSDTMTNGTYKLYNFNTSTDILDASTAWFIDGAGRLTSNDIADYESTSYQIHMSNVDTYDISFDYGVSSETNYDYLTFINEGNINISTSGLITNSYTSSNVDSIDGKLDLDWTYEKDLSVSSNNDNAWIDNLALTTYSSATAMNFNEDILTKIIKITNIGGGSLLITNMFLSDITNFSLQNGCTSSLGYNASCEIKVTYTGTYNTSHTTTLSYDTNDNNNLHIEKVFDVRPSSNMVPIINYLLF